MHSNLFRRGVILALFPIIALSTVGVIVSSHAFKTKTVPSSQKNTKKEVAKPVLTDAITISPQALKDKVFIDSATLCNNGFVVIRELDEGKLGQVIEISKPLTVGTHKDITISLGNADVQNKDLVVMIYDDYANDRFFNDFDMPALNQNGNMIGNYVSTGKPLPISITEGENTAMQGMNMPNTSMTKVMYTDKGFVPNKVEVSVGSMVEFINNSSTDMWVASNPHPQHTDLPTFDQFRPYKKNSIFRYTFTKKGAWGFHDHLNASRNGTITVN